MPQTASILVSDPVIRDKRIVTTILQIEQNHTPVVGQEVLVEQKSHQFLFGSTWGEDSIDLANGELFGERKAQTELRNTFYLDLFNMVTMPFYWSRFEPQRGHPDTRRILTSARWYRDQGCRVKGHPLCWHTLTADWLLKLSPEKILSEQQARIRRDVSNFAGVIDTWDVVNEAVIMPVFEKYDNGITRLCQAMGRIPLIRTMFETARSTNPHATLLLNDFDVSPAYDILVEGCLEAGIQIDAIGIQSHMHQGYWGIEKTEQVLERFERFYLPIHFTENTIVSGHLMPPEIVDLNDYRATHWPTTPEGEERQAEEVVKHYKTLMAHPAVQAISWWDFMDGGWLGAPAGLLRKDYTPKPAYQALLGLVKGEWWLPLTQLVTDDAGEITVSGFPGEYEITLGGFAQRFTLSPADPRLTLTVE